MGFKLYPWQEKAVDQLSSGKVLYGGVGSGKTLTALSFYKKNYSHIPLYVITTAKKRDTHDWEKEAKMVGIEDLTVDSWNNIKDYKNVYNSFFIFDEQRAVGYGAWGKNFIKICHLNAWLMLSGTPGDNWTDYMVLFIANNWYKNKTDFENQHVEYDRFAKFPKIKAYHNVGKLQHLRTELLVKMDMTRETERERIDIVTGYNQPLYRSITQTRQDPDTGRPFQSASGYTQCMRKLVSTSQDRIERVTKLIQFLDRPIIFYNYNYELETLLDICSKIDGRTVAQWNGRKHEEIPETSSWVYLVQYTAGAEGWNCTSTDTVIFYSPNYSYKIMEQAEGRIDRLNTSFKHLKYYFVQSASPIDRAVFKAIEKKRRFNEAAWAKESLGQNVRELLSTTSGISHSRFASASNLA